VHSRNVCNKRVARSIFSFQLINYSISALQALREFNVVRLDRDFPLARWAPPFTGQI
jgi:hypothetical protein